MPVVRARFTGDSAAVENLLKVIEGMEDLQHMEEVANLGDHMREDSSSAGLTDDIGGDFHDIKMHFATSAEAERARDVVEVAARSSDVVVEFLDRF
jgi:uncharacterized membrane-anchored protein YhcB (DUF1043 family)